MTAPAWTILAFFGAIGLTAKVVQAVCRRRADRAWAAGIASRVHDREYLEWLEREFAKTNGGRT